MGKIRTGAASKTCGRQAIDPNLTMAKDSRLRHKPHDLVFPPHRQRLPV